MNAGVTAWDLVEANFKIFNEVMQVKENAFDALKERHSNLPTILKLGRLMKGYLDEDNFHVLMNANLPCGDCGDGVGVNEKAARIMCEIYGLPIPSYRCSAHSADGTWKRIARSKTMNVEQVGFVSLM